MLPVVLFVSLFAVGCLGDMPFFHGPPKKVVEIPIPKAVTKHKPLRKDRPFDHHEEVPIKKTEVRRVVQKVPLIHEVPIFVHKNKPFLSPVAVPRKIQVHEVVGIPVIHDKHVIQPVYIDRPYVVEKKKFIPQPYPVHKPVPIDFIKKITKIYDRKVEVPHEVPVPLVKTIDRPRPVPFTREVVRYYDVHVKVPRPRPVKLTKHVTHVEKVPFETPNVIVQKKPVHHEIKEFIPKVPQVHVQKFRVPSPPAMGVIGPKFAPQPRLLQTRFFDGRNGRPLLAGDIDAKGGGAKFGRPSVRRGGTHTGRPFKIGRYVSGGWGPGGGGARGGFYAFVNGRGFGHGGHGGGHGFGPK